MKSAEIVLDPELAAKFILQIGHCGWLGMTYSAHGEDWAELEIPWREDLLGDEERQVMATGPIISLLDMASGLAIWTKRKAFVPVATLDLRVDYLRPSRAHMPVRGRVTCYRDTRSAAFVRGVAYDEDVDDPVATMAGVFMNVGMGGKNGG